LAQLLLYQNPNALASNATWISFMGQHSSRIIVPQLPHSTRFVDFADNGRTLSGSMPKLRELRENVFFQAECLYLQNLVSLTGRNIRKACELSGLSRSRLYTLLKKYQITPPLNDHCLQK
jgi:DNA-binding NtrC family response regulator